MHSNPSHLRLAFAIEPLLEVEPIASGSLNLPDVEGYLCMLQATSSP